MLPNPSSSASAAANLTAAPEPPNEKRKSDQSVSNANQSQAETVASSQNLPKVNQRSVTDLASNVLLEKLRSVFGDAQLLWKSSRDPEIPARLQTAPQETDDAVLTVRCGNGLAALLSTDEGFGPLFENNQVLSNGLASSWGHCLIFWGRVNSTVPSADALKKKGVELVQSGLIPVARDSINMRTLIDHWGPLLAFESLDLSFANESDVRDVQIPGQLTSTLRDLFGEAKVQIVSALDSAIPQILRPVDSTPQHAHNVVALSCENGLGVVICEHKHLSELENCNPFLRTCTLTHWERHYLFWIRLELSVDDRPPLDQSASRQLVAGALFIGQGLIPVATEGGEIYLVRRGTIPGINLTQQGKEASSSPGVVGGTPPTQSDRPEDGKQAQDPKSQETASPPGGEMQELRTVFGEDSVLENIRADDPRVPSWLAAMAAVGSTDFDPADSDLLGVQCGPHSTGHLAAVVCYQEAALETFRVKNPKLFCIGTVWCSLTVIWLRVQGPVPRNLNTGTLTWVSQGIVPVSVVELTVIRRSGAQIPLTRFDEIQWDNEVAHAFEADEIQQSHGSPFLPIQPRAWVLDPVFLSRLLLARLGLDYDLARETFRRFDAGTGTWAAISRPRIVQLVTNRLIRLSHDFPSQFPPTEVKKGTVRNLIYLMEVQGAVEIPTTEEAAERFFAEAVEKCAGAELIQKDFYAGHERFCKSRGWTACSQAYFDKAATRQFGRTSHYFQNGTARGRVGWRLREEVISSPAKQDKGPVDEPDNQTPTPDD